MLTEAAMVITGFAAGFTCAWYLRRVRTAKDKVVFVDQNGNQLDR